MITRPVPAFDTTSERNKWYFRKELRICDHRRAFDALEEIDRLLGLHGLEVIVYTDISDPDPLFEIVKREVDQ